jgi:hypothetical protein
MRSIVFALLVAVVAAGSLAFAQPLDKGWWVVLGAFPLDPPERQRQDAMKMTKAALACRLRVFNDFSGKFSGFEPGHNVFVIGAFATRARARAEAGAAQRCFPGAYVKRGDYAGE